MNINEDIVCNPLEYAFLHLICRCSFFPTLPPSSIPPVLLIK